MLSLKQVNSLNSKLRAVKRDKDDIEGEMETLKTRQRQLRSQIEEHEDTISSLESQISKMRSAGRKKVCLIKKYRVSNHIYIFQENYVQCFLVALNLNLPRVWYIILKPLIYLEFGI